MCESVREGEGGSEEEGSVCVCLYKREKEEGKWNSVCGCVREREMWQRGWSYIKSALFESVKDEKKRLL